VSATTAPSSRGSLGSGAVTAAALAVQTGLAAIVGVIIARKFGRNAETDGFFAAYAVFVVLVLAATAIRVTVLPRYARASAGSRLASEVVATARALAIVEIPLIVVCALARDPLAALLTGFGPAAARDAAAAALPWMVVAAAAQLAAGILASALAALDDYVIAAAGYIVGSAAGLALILLAMDAHGIVSIAWGMTLNAAVAALVPATALAVRARRRRMPRAALGVERSGVGRRLLELADGISIPLGLQLVYLICLPIASRNGVGAVSSLSYGYLLGSAVITVTASSIGLVTSVPLTRTGLDPARIARHLVASSWIAVIATGATAGIFATAGPSIVDRVLGPDYGGGAGDELARVVVALVPWMIVTIAVSLVFPLVFVEPHGGRLFVIGALMAGAQVPLALAGQALGGLTGIAIALALSTAVGLAGMLNLVGATELTLRGLLPVLGVVGAITAVAFVPVGLLLPGVAAGLLGAAIYAVLFLVIRPSGLTGAWRYLHRLG
jgi:hypothetical protein